MLLSIPVQIDSNTNRIILRYAFRTSAHPLIYRLTEQMAGAKQLTTRQLRTVYVSYEILIWKAKKLRMRQDDPICAQEYQ